MSLFPKFDPWTEIEETSNRAAKVAKVAKVHTTVSSRGPRPGSAAWDAGDWQSYFDERAAIAEIDGKLSRSEAEARAYHCAIAEWLSRNSVTSEPGRCVKCGKEDSTYCQVIPFGSADHGHAWLHDKCWPEWHERRVRQATEALSEFGLRPPSRP